MGRFGWVGVALALAGCATQGAVRQDEQLQTRLLSANEKAGLSKSLSSTLKDPVAAQFKWMPVIVRQRGGITDYCGLLNGKNTYGGYNGFVPFYAQLQADQKGEFYGGEIRLISGPGQEGFSGDIAVSSCRDYGYSDFSQAK